MKSPQHLQWLSFSRTKHKGKTFPTSTELCCPNIPWGEGCWQRKTASAAVAFILFLVTITISPHYPWKICPLRGVSSLWWLCSFLRVISFPPIRTPLSYPLPKHLSLFVASEASSPQKVDDLMVKVIQINFVGAWHPHVPLVCSLGLEGHSIPWLRKSLSLWEPQFFVARQVFPWVNPWKSQP